jgi:alkanesulfonate monooxygenase SsuD/methylene tetrahydromethanopterin reductase-like flavin-dependent oxidoreductase (luciferase family)
MAKFYLDCFLYTGTVAEFRDGLRMSGTDPQRYQRVLGQLAEHAVVADQGGFEGLSFSEQHANIEGLIEVSTNPIMLDLFVAARTERIKVGQLGMVLTANHPLRIAEDIALLDQLTGGRAFCGVARGNAKRWVNIFAQHFGVEAAHSDKSEADERNLRAVKEAWQIMKSAWTQDTFSIDGEFWTVPAPDTMWGFPPTASHGQGMRADGVLTEIGCVPRPLQTPHPRVFTPLAFRMTTATFWVGEGATAVCFADKDDFMKTAFDYLGERAAAGGVPRVAPALAPGAFLMMGETAAEAEAIRADFAWLFEHAYTVPPFNVPMGRIFFGTPDDVSRQIEAMLKIAPFEEFFLWHNIGLHDERLASRSLELFAEKVIPRFT